MPRIIIQLLSPFPYKGSKMVPGNYENKTLIIEESSQQATNVNLSKVHHLTRSNRCYTLTRLKSETQQENTSPVAQALTLATKNSNSIVVKGLVNEKKFMKFLKFIKHYEYNVVNQLNKQPAKISMLSLLLNFKVYMNVLLKVLNEAYVSLTSL